MKKTLHYSATVTKKLQFME